MIAICNKLLKKYKNKIYGGMHNVYWSKSQIERV
ncbi:hypothetical protein SAMN02194393_03718 [Maledivibacter halophilus]|uniref:Uncharacterized protein n=1 Tax=Maledivibacter halophilus TaxID=36842 RepID=A0A1T5M2D0_9FIRM|nr:hypothetical protein SAMN02194393_03718 [Maledivibacter halophilus]